jgi:hypothetical protein
MGYSMAPKGEGRTLFVGALTALLGLFNIFQGLVLIIEDERYVASADADFVLVGDFTTWGWIILLLGIFQLFVSGALFNGQPWGRVVGIIGTGLVALAQFPLLAGSFPIWSLLIVGICVWLIAGLAEYEPEG